MRDRDRQRRPRGLERARRRRGSSRRRASAKTAASAWPIRSRSRKSGSVPTALKHAGVVAAGRRRRPRARDPARPAARRSPALPAGGRSPCPSCPAPKITTSFDRSPTAAADERRSIPGRRWASRSRRCGRPAAIVSTPRGRICRSPRMIATTRDSAGSGASRSGTPVTPWRARRRTSNSTICTWPVGEHVRLPGRRHADDLGDGERGLALRGDDEVDVSSRSCQTSRYSTSPCGRRARIGREPAREHRGDDVDLVPRRAGDERSASRTPASMQRLPAGAVAVHRAHVEAERERASRAGSTSTTVMSCSSWSASTTAVPTCPAPTTRIRIAAEANAGLRRLSQGRSRQTCRTVVPCRAGDVASSRARARPRHAGALRHRLRQRRLVDLLRARRHRRRSRSA